MDLLQRCLVCVTTFGHLFYASFGQISALVPEVHEILLLLKQEQLFEEIQAIEAFTPAQCHGEKLKISGSIQKKK